MFRKPIIAATMAMAASLSAVMFSSTAAQADPDVSNADIDTVRVALAKYAVPEPTQKALLQAFARGQQWDSETGAAPVDTQVSDVGGATRTIYRYQDGSISVSTVEIPSPGGNRSITGCQSYPVTGAKAWRNCKVAWDNMTWSVAFTSAYKYYLGPSYGCRIDSIGGLTHGGAGGFSEPKLEFITQSANGYTGQCIAQGTYTRSIGPAGSHTVGVRLNLTAQHGGGWSSRVGAS